MGTILANTVLDLVAADLTDKNFAVISKVELTRLMNMGQREFVHLKPDINPITGIWQMTAGTRQSLPDGSDSFKDPGDNTLPAAVQLISPVRNMGADGVTPGDSLLLKTPDEMNRLFPDWHTDTESAAAEVIVYDKDTPLQVWTYPKQPSNPGWMEMIYSALVDDITVETAGADTGTPTADATINIPDILSTGLVDFIIHRYMLKHATHAANASLAAAHKENYLQALGIRENKEKDPER